MIIAPSILTADFMNLAKEIKRFSNAKLLHLDIMDGSFVPNISFGPHIASCIAKQPIPLDVHLMVKDPTLWITPFSKCHPKYITVHFETENYQKAIKQIKQLGIKAGISINPSTTVKSITSILSEIDLILVMSVVPGYGGQSFISTTYDKIRELIKIRELKKLNFLISVDGGINDTNIEKLDNVDICVVGSYLVNLKNPKNFIKKFE